MGAGGSLQRVYHNDISVYQKESIYFITRNSCDMEEMTLTQSWEIWGFYIFVPWNCKTNTSFFDEIMELQKRCSEKLLFLWIENPQDRYWKWVYHVILTNQTSGIIRKLGRYSKVSFDRYHLGFGGNLSVTCREDEFAFFADPSEQGAFYVQFNQITAYGNPLGTSNKNLTESSNEIKLLANGDRMGCFICSVVIPPQEENSFLKMGVGIKYSMPLSKEVKEPWRYGHVETLTNPILNYNKEIILEVRLHPAEPLNVEKTKFIFQNIILESSFTTANGKSLRLSTGDNASLVFERTPVYLSKDKEKGDCSGDTQYYLGLQGDFQLEIPTKKLLCGLSGMEYADFSKAMSSIITFRPHQNSFIEGELLSSVATTAWIGFPEGLWYYCQPETAPLFTSKEAIGLRLLEVPTTIFKEKPQEVPFMCYRNSINSVSSDDDYSRQSYSVMEENIYKTRRKLFDNKSNNNMNEEVEQMGMTPQGLMVGVSIENGKWNWIGLANTEGNILSLPNLILTKISDELRNKFMQSKMFLCIDQKEDFLRMADPGKDFFITVEGWTFLVSPNDWRTQFGNKNSLVIFKYTDEKSILQLLGDNAILQESIHACYDQQGGEIPYYKEFIDTVSSPQFQGIVFLNCDILIGKLPNQLAFLLRNIDTSEFYAHHVIFRENRIKQDSNHYYKMEQTTITALIDYKSKGELACQEGKVPYELSVTKLLLAVKNSLINQFSCSVELFITKFFEAKCSKLDTTTGNSLVLDGVCEQNDNLTQYNFSLRDKGLFELENSAIRAVEINSVGVSFPGKEGNPGVISLDGLIDFAEISDCDLLSFGEESNVVSESESKLKLTQGLKFQQLHINIPWEGDLFISYEVINYDVQGSIPRLQSFGSRFACDFSHLIMKSEKTPEELGFGSITCPISQEELEKDWVGMVWELNLGSLGDLSSKEVFTIELLMAWSQKEKGIGYYIGVKLPALLGGEGIDFQGILKLGFQSVELVVQNEEKINYMLRLHNFSLRVLGLLFPKGSSDIFIFADGKKLGWYAAFLGEEEG